jgi:predicted metal-binding membrane protein
MASERASQRVFLGVSALLFAASAAVTILWCASMSAMGGMPMPGGWTMSMVVGCGCPGRRGSAPRRPFLGVWVVMMVAMMLPSLVPCCGAYREAVAGAGEAHLGRRTALGRRGVTFFVWAAFGLAAFALGVALADFTMRQPAVSRAVPALIGFGGPDRRLSPVHRVEVAHARLLIARRPGSGARSPRTREPPAHGVRLGLHCVHSCANLMAILLVLGAMDLHAMAVVCDRHHRRASPTDG